MNKSIIGEQIWQGDHNGFLKQLCDAGELVKGGQAIQGYCLCATAYYSHYASQLRRKPWRAVFEFGRAQNYARLVARTAMLSELSHGQCDVVGTILLRRWLWMRGDAGIAVDFLIGGLDKEDVPYHSRALMTIGLAEGYFRLTRRNECFVAMTAALSFESFVWEEKDQKQARRQFSRVLRRAATLYFRLGDTLNADHIHEKALEYTNHPDYGSKDQAMKIRQEWKILHLPHFVQAFLPC